MGHWARVGLILSTFALSLFCSGIIYGWNDMQLLMQHEGMFCKANCGSKNEVYDDLQYNLIITVAEVRRAGPVPHPALRSCFIFLWSVCGRARRSPRAAES